MDLGERIKSARKDAQMTQADLGKAVNVTREAVSLWESGQTQPATSNLGLIASALSIQASHLLGESVANPEQNLDACTNIDPTILDMALAVAFAELKISVTIETIADVSEIASLLYEEVAARVASDPSIDPEQVVRDCSGTVIRLVRRQKTRV